MHFRCEFNRSVDTQLCKVRDGRAFSIVSLAIDYTLAGDFPGCYQGRRDDNTYRLDFQLISASTISCTETAVRT